MQIQIHRALLLVWDSKIQETIMTVAVIPWNMILFIVRVCYVRLSYHLLLLQQRYCTLTNIHNGESAPTQRRTYDKHRYRSTNTITSISTRTLKHTFIKTPTNSGVNTNTCADDKYTKPNKS